MIFGPTKNKVRRRTRPTMTSFERGLRIAMGHARGRDDLDTEEEIGRRLASYLETLSDPALDGL